MFKKKPPAITIGSSLGVTRGRSSPAVPLAPGALSTSVQPSALVRAGDALGNLIFKSAPVVALGAAAIVREFGSTAEDRQIKSPWTDSSHPDYQIWRSRLDDN